MTNQEEKIRTRDRRYVWHPWSPLNVDRSELTLSSAEGYIVKDINGNKYIDCASLNLTCGYNNDYVINAIHNQLRKFHGTDISLASNEVVGILAERIAKLLPEKLTKTLFVNSGSEGIEAAVFIAASYWKQINKPKTRIIAFQDGYHGSTFLSRNVGKLPRVVGHPLGEQFSLTHVTLPTSSKELYQEKYLEPLLQAFKEAITADIHNPAAAVVVEPFLNVGGGILLPHGFLNGLRKLCDETQTLLILDEVFTGYGRTGKMFAFEHERISPDILVSSKGLASGYMPIAAVTTTEEIYDSFTKDTMIGGLRYGHTTSGHAAACAGALATLDVIEKNNLSANATMHGRKMFIALSKYRDIGKIVDIRQLGLILAIEMVSFEEASKLRTECQELGLLIRQPGNTLMIVPPMTIDNAGIEKILNIIEPILTKGFCA